MSRQERAVRIRHWQERNPPTAPVVDDGTYVRFTDGSTWFQTLRTTWHMAEVPTLDARRKTHRRAA
jgi:hypothetical protein